MRRKLLAWLRVPERPDPPPGSGADLQVFRASRRYLQYTYLQWALKQLGAFIGLVFSLMLFGSLGRAWVPIELPEVLDQILDNARIPFILFSVRLGDLLVFFEAFAVVVFLIQLVLSGFLLRLAWEARWYMVGETSLRIRRGLWSLREQTMTIANIQNMIVRQGPVQRLMGISDLEVHTAGGGRRGEGEESNGGDDKHSFHVGRLRGLEDAAGLRDVLRERISGAAGAGASPQPRQDDERPGGPEELLAAARELRDEARALRLAGSTSGR